MPAPLATSEEGEPGVSERAPPAAEKSLLSVDELPSRFYKVNFAYLNENNEEDTLTLHVGDILIVLETHEDGWWRGQSGDQVGLFPVAYCESVGEAEVKAFISKTNARVSKKSAAASPGGGAGGAGGGGGASGTPAGGRAELEREMKELKAEEAELAVKVQALKDEVAHMKEEARKLRKKTREELLEVFDTLPASLYQIPIFQNIQQDLIRCAILIARVLDMEVEHRDLLPNSIIACSSFVEEGPKAVAGEPKLKLEIDRIVSKVLALQKYLIDEHANVDAQLPLKVVEDLELLASQISLYTQGELDTSKPNSPAGMPALKMGEAQQQQAKASEWKPGKSPRKSSKVSKVDNRVDGAAKDGEDASTPTSPREKIKKKKSKEDAAAADGDSTGATSAGTTKKKKKKKHEDEDETTATSPRDGTKKKKKKAKTTAAVSDNAASIASNAAAHQLEEHEERYDALEQAHAEKYDHGDEQDNHDEGDRSPRKADDHPHHEEEEVTTVHETHETPETHETHETHEEDQQPPQEEALEDADTAQTEHHQHTELAAEETQDAE